MCLVHEHILSDLRDPYWTEPADPELAELSRGVVSLEKRGAWLRNTFSIKSALVLDSVSVAVDEIALFKRAGGQTIVENSCIGINGDPRGLLRISEETGVHIVASAGYYIAKSHPEWVRDKSIAELSEIVIRDIEDGIDGTDIRAGVMADVGTTGSIAPAEQNTLRACARAQLATGVGLGVHCDPSALEGMRVVEILLEEGVSPARICLQHMDEASRAPTGDDYHLRLADHGVWLEFDTFGAEYSGSATSKPKPHDADRARSVRNLIDHGHLDQLLLSQDIFNKFQLRTWGGEGYTSLFDHGVPWLLQAGVTQSQIDAMLIDNPARYLTVVG